MYCVTYLEWDRKNHTVDREKVLAGIASDWGKYEAKANNTFVLGDLNIRVGTLQEGGADEKKRGGEEDSGVARVQARGVAPADGLRARTAHPGEQESVDRQVAQGLWPLAGRAHLSSNNYTHKIDDNKVGNNKNTCMGTRCCNTC